MKKCFNFYPENFDKLIGLVPDWKQESWKIYRGHGTLKTTLSTYRGFELFEYSDNIREHVMAFFLAIGSWHEPMIQLNNASCLMSHHCHLPPPFTLYILFSKDMKLETAIVMPHAFLSSFHHQKLLFSALFAITLGTARTSRLLVPPLSNFLLK